MSSISEHLVYKSLSLSVDRLAIGLCNHEGGQSRREQTMVHCTEKEGL